MENLRGKKIIFIGDSITDVSKKACVANPSFNNVGGGYVYQIANMLYSKYPDINLQIINAGISGNTTRELKARLDSDVLSCNADIATLYIGINDVWRHFNEHKNNPESFVSIEEYEANMVELVTKIKGNVEKLYIISPHYLVTDITNPMKSMMLEYAGVAKKVAEQFSLPYIDVQSAFDTYLQYRDASTISADNVHLNLLGSTIIARTILKSILA